MEPPRVRVAHKMPRTSDRDPGSGRSLISFGETLQTSDTLYWLKEVLSGIDVSIFTAHSTRSASVSAAVDSGVTTSDI